MSDHFDWIAALDQKAAEQPQPIPSASGQSVPPVAGDTSSSIADMAGEQVPILQASMAGRGGKGDIPMAGGGGGGGYSGGRAVTTVQTPEPKAYHGEMPKDFRPTPANQNPPPGTPEPRAKNTIEMPNASGMRYDPAHLNQTSNQNLTTGGARAPKDQPENLQMPSHFPYRPHEAAGARIDADMGVSANTNKFGVLKEKYKPALDDVIKDSGSLAELVSKIKNLFGRLNPEAAK